MGAGLSERACPARVLPRMKLLRNLVLLGPLPQPEKSAGGIALSASYSYDNWQYRVLAVGPGKRLRDGTILCPEVRPGDRCLFRPGVGNPYTFEDGRLIVEADQILMLWPTSELSDCAGTVLAQPELHLPDETRAYIMDRVKHCPVCRRFAVMYRSYLTGRPRYVVKCSEPTCGNALCWTDSSRAAVRAWETYCVLCKE